MARAPGADWGALAGKYSDDPDSASRGGQKGIFRRGQLKRHDQVIGDALFGMEIGQVSDPVWTPMGFHVVSRMPIYSASHIVIQYKGSQRANEEVTRTREEAEKLAGEVLLKALVEGADFAALAREYSDGPTGKGGGYLNFFATAQMVREFDEALALMDFDEVRGVITTKFGFHVLKRERMIGARHILITHNRDCKKPKEGVTRSKEEARELAANILADAQKNDTDFAALVKKYSESSVAAEGGDLGMFARGEMVPAFDTVAFGLKVGELGGPVDTDFGFHIILRTE